MTRIPFFVYGTLKPGGSNYPAYLAGHTLHESPATLRGAALYTAGPFPFLVLGAPLAAPDEQVHGVVMTMRPDRYTQVLRAIDMLEHYRPGDPANLYERRAHTVQTNDGTPTEVWLYTAAAQTHTAIAQGRLWQIAGGNWSEP